jgi:hypothetical protein
MAKIPEPSTVILAALGGLMLFACRRRLASRFPRASYQSLGFWFVSETAKRSFPGLPHALMS